MINGVTTDEEFKANFRLDRTSFYALVEELKPRLSPIARSFNPRTLCATIKVALTLYYLKDTGSLRMVANQFGIAKSTASLTIRQVCSAINEILGPRLIKFPSLREEVEATMAGFKRKFGFPMVLGCIDGTHIPIQQPTENASD